MPTQHLLIYIYEMVHKKAAQVYSVENQFCFILMNGKVSLENSSMKNAEKLISEFYVGI